jgi:uncharacterized protein
MTLLDNVVKWFLPKEVHFFDLLERGAAHAVDASNLLSSLCKSENDVQRAEWMTKLKDCEHAADAVIHEVYDALNRTFVTPMDRSDLYALATSLEDIVDAVHATALQTSVHALDRFPAGTAELVALIQTSTVEVQFAVKVLREPKNMEKITAHCRQLSRLEHDGDEVFRREVAALFRNEKNAVRLIQDKEFLEGLERTLDTCDHVGTALTSIVIKNG